MQSLVFLPCGFHALPTAEVTGLGRVVLPPSDVARLVPARLTHLELGLSLTPLLPATAAHSPACSNIRITVHFARTRR